MISLIHNRLHNNPIVQHNINPKFQLNSCFTIVSCYAIIFPYEITHENWKAIMTNYDFRRHSTAVHCLRCLSNVPFPAPNSIKHWWSTSRPNFSKWPTKEAWKRGEKPGMGINMNQILMLSNKDNRLPGWSPYVAVVSICTTQHGHICQARVWIL